MKKFIRGLLFLALLFSASVQAQEIFVPRPLKAVEVRRSKKDELPDGYLPYHRLTRDDFPVNDKAFPPDDKTYLGKNAMITSYFSGYWYKAFYTREGDRVSARITEWKVQSGFDRNKSARRSGFKYVERLLPHEQGHLDINELHSRRMANIELDKLPFGEGANADEAAKNLEIKLTSIAAKVSREIEAEQTAYDAKTAHGTNQSEQKKATAALQVRLRQAGISSSY